jgi:hypothetical protein
MDREGIFMREAAGWCCKPSCPTHTRSQTELPGPPPDCGRRRSGGDDRPAPLSVSSLIAELQKVDTDPLAPSRPNRSRKKWQGPGKRR